MEKPKIRFKGYQEDWEQRKLPEFVTFFNGLTYTPEDVEETGTLVLRSSNVKNGEIVDADNVYVNDKVVTSENVQEGDIIVVVRNGSRALIGKHAQIKASMPNTVIGAFMSGMRSEHSSFVNALLDTSAFENEIAKNMGATINQITGYMFSKMEFMIPSGEEQQKIGEYFQGLDHLITLHQRKCEEMKILKKYMLQKMFPQNGQLVPQIRFSGFTEDWEQRKVTELLKNSSSAMKIGPFGSALKKEYFVEEGIKVYAQENAFTGDFSMGDYYITEDKYKELKSCELYPGDLVISMMGTIGACAIFPKNAEKGIMNSHLLRLQFNNEVIPEYIMYLLRDSVLIRKQIDRLSVGSIMSGLSSSVVKKLVFPIPKLAEQKRIVEYLDSIDRLITLHQQKCDELRNIKKFMLQNMFI